MRILILALTIIPIQLAFGGNGGIIGGGGFNGTSFSGDSELSTSDREVFEIKYFKKDTIETVLTGGAGHIGGSPNSASFYYDHDVKRGIRFLGKVQSEYVFEILNSLGERQVFSLRIEELDGSILNAILESERNSGKVVELTEI